MPSALLWSRTQLFRMGWAETFGTVSRLPQWPAWPAIVQRPWRSYWETWANAGTARRFHRPDVIDLLSPSASLTLSLGLGPSH